MSGFPLSSLSSRLGKRLLAVLQADSIHHSRERFVVTSSRTSAAIRETTQGGEAASEIEIHDMYDVCVQVCTGR